MVEIVEVLGETHLFNGLHVHISKKELTEAFFSYPFRTDQYVFLLVLSGSIKVQLNLITYTVESNEILAFTPKTIIDIGESSHKVDMIVISFSIDYLLKTPFKSFEINAFDFFFTDNIVKLELTNRETTLFVTLAELLVQKSIAKEEFFKDEIIAHSFGLFMYHYASVFRRIYPTLEIEMSRQEELAFRFEKILNENLKQERSVQFYAEALYVTPGHLSKVLKEVSGKTAAQIINSAVMMEARVLLKNPSLTIAQVADELQFSNQSFFGKYFKKNIGYSPSEYRKNI
tara:strand:+ start:8312 stop:9172 length:861 start_codon:yes stop_codon:yes gene_type:complete